MFTKINELCSQIESFDLNTTSEKLFIDAMIENYSFQLENQSYIKYLYDKSNIDINSIKSIDDIFNIPPLFVETMKYHGFCSVKPEDIHMTLKSSGTGGQKTQSFFDKDSTTRLETLSYNTFKKMGYTSSKPVHYFVMAYDIRKASDVGTSWSDNFVMSLAPSKSTHWLIEWDEKKKTYYFDEKKWARKFIELSSDAPVRLLGFPAYMYKLLEEVKKLSTSVSVHEDSFIVAGGGWKNHLGKSMTLNEFSNYIESTIKLPSQNIGDTYGMAEHGVPYCSCPYGHYHIPIYSRLIVRDPLTMKIQPTYKEGLLQLFTPYNTAQPNLSVLSKDVVTIGENCPCGIDGLYIKSISRGGLKKHKGCSIAAQEILNKQKEA